VSALSATLPAALASAAVYLTVHPGVRDTLVQRAGLCLIAVGGTAAAYGELVAGAPSSNASLTLNLGCAGYLAATGFRAWLQQKKKK
jgi:hypothetical protein